jgi:hypothetical protein
MRYKVYKSTSGPNVEPQVIAACSCYIRRYGEWEGSSLGAREEGRGRMSSNGSNARLDRIEELIHEGERANQEAHARHEREIAESRAKFDRQMAESSAKFDRQMRRWIALGVQEARNQRKRSQKLDEDIGRLVSSQLETKAMLNEFIASLKTGGNGGPKAS